MLQADTSLSLPIPSVLPRITVGLSLWQWTKKLPVSLVVTSKPSISWNLRRIILSTQSLKKHQKDYPRFNWSYLWHSTAERIVLLTYWLEFFFDIWKAVDPCQEHHKSPPSLGSNVTKWLSELCLLISGEYLRLSSVSFKCLVTSKIWHFSSS